jgi:hypothetical protein
MKEFFNANKILIIWSTVAIIVAASFFSFLASLTYVENYEMGYSFDKFSGTIEKFDRTGYFVKPWWQYEVNTIDLRPTQVSITANQRVLNAKLVKFDPEGLDTFLEWHGRGAGEDLTQLQDILKSYAYKNNRGADCPFLIILEEINEGDNPPKTSTQTPSQNDR